MRKLAVLSAWVLLLAIPARANDANIFDYVVDGEATAGPAVAKGNGALNLRARLNTPSIMGFAGIPVWKPTSGVETGVLGAGLNLRAEGAWVPLKKGTYDLRLGDVDAVVGLLGTFGKNKGAQVSLGSLSGRLTQNQVDGPTEAGVNGAAAKLWYKAEAAGGRAGMCVLAKILSATQGLHGRTIHPVEGEVCGFAKVSTSLGELTLRDRLELDLANRDGKSIIDAQSSKVTNRFSVGKLLESRLPAALEYEVSRSNEGGQVEFKHALNAGLMF